VQGGVKPTGVGMVLEVGSYNVRIVKQIGEGAYSQVFHVKLLQNRSRPSDDREAPSSSRPVERDLALKLMRCQTPELMKRAKLEVKVLSECQHENIIRLLDSSIVTSHNGEDNEVWFLLPLYRKGTLRSVLDEMSKTKKRFSERHILKLFLGLCRAVHVLHSLDPPLVHRDIKSLNILLSDDEESVVLTDFGSVAEARRKINSAKEAIALEHEADHGCSPLFRPPELYHPDNCTEIDERTDVWSLGCTLYEMAFWKNPFEIAYTDHDASIKLSVLSAKFDFPEDSPFSEEFHKLIRELMHKDFQSRPFVDKVIERVQKMIES
jgi:serine/threonine kinase 16